MVLVLGLLYLRKSANEFDPLAKRIVDRYANVQTGNGAGPAAEREPVGSRAADTTAEAPR